MQNAGIVVDNPATLVGFGDLTTFGPAAALAGFVLIAVLAARGVPGAVIIGLLVVAVMGWLFGGAEFSGVVSAPPSPAPVFLALDIAGALELSMLAIILSLLLVDVFDTSGTLVAVTMRANLLEADGKLPRLRSALFADSSATLAGSVFGTSSTTSFIESAAGWRPAAAPG